MDLEDRTTTIAVIGLIVLVIVGGLVTSGAVADPETELVGSITLGETFAGVMFLAVTGLGLLSAYVGGTALRMAYRIWSNDPVPAGEAHREVDVIEVQGTAEPIRGTTSSQYTGTDSLAHTWKKKRKRNRQDDDGMDTWNTTEEGQDGVPFYVTDESGKIAVDPDGASMSLASHVERQNRTGRYHTRMYEGRLEPGDTVHVYGQRREATDGGGAPGEGSVYVGDGDGTFKISDTTQGRTVLRSSARGLAYLVFGLFVIVLGFFAVPGLL